MKAAFRSITKDYLIAPDEETITRLKKASSQGSTLNLICPDHMLRTDLFPGFSRLALLANQSMDRFKQVAQNWYELWTYYGLTRDVLGTTRELLGTQGHIRDLGT